MSDNWYHETLFSGYGQRFQIDRVLFEAKTEHQHLIIFENSQFGHVMALDGVIQTTTRDECIYHEMMTHVPVLAHGHVKHVLVIGGGDGGILRELFKHPTIQSVTMVEIDATVVEMSKRYFPTISQGAFDNPRLSLVIDDGINFLRCAEQNAFDLIITDSTDPVGAGAVLFTEEFYRHCKRCLDPAGIIVNQNGASFLQEWEFSRTSQLLKPFYHDTWFYMAGVPTYLGGFMMFAWGTDCAHYRSTSLEVIKHRFHANPFDTKYYNPGMHVSAFNLPQHVLDKLTTIQTASELEAS